MGIGELGYGIEDVDALVEGALKQQRLLVIAPREASEDDLAAIIGDSMENWAGATAADGDTLFIVRLPNSDLAEPASRAIKEAISKNGQVGLMVHSTVDHGSVLILVIGVHGVDGGVPSQANEELARECAIRPHSSDGEPA